MNTRHLLISAVALFSLAACGPDPIDPRRQIGASLFARHPSVPAAAYEACESGRLEWQGTHRAPGLTIKALATGLKSPRMVTTLPNGDVLVVESEAPPSGGITRPKDFIMGLLMAMSHSKEKAGNRIILLREADGDGAPELKTVFIDHLHSPFGVVLVGSDIYVANADAIMRYPYQAGQTQITAPGVKLTDLPGGPINHHWTKSLVAGPDGTKLYAGVGSNSNITENGIGAELDRAQIWEIDRTTGAHRPYATGLRNPNGLLFEPQTKMLWTVVNERDELGLDLVPDYMTSVKEGAFYGWPYSYYGQHVDPRVMPQRPDMVAKAIPADYALSSHVAPLGMTFSENAKLGQAYSEGAFVAEHGSWDRTHFNGYKIVFVPFADGHPSGMPRDVITGFLDGDTARGRPVSVAIDNKGALLIADDAGNTVWRVTTNN
jgi:glucose/arabinose dehydrogenase